MTASSSGDNPAVVEKRQKKDTRMVLLRPERLVAPELWLSVSGIVPSSGQLQDRAEIACLSRRLHERANKKVCLQSRVAGGGGRGRGAPI